MLRERDVLVHHPYESFATSVEVFVAQAADDPDVLGIKQTLYRTSGDSPIVASLIRAAESGKQVAALVELKARFDEEANIGWAKALEDAGVHVVYGIVGFKTHSKTALVLRREGDGDPPLLPRRDRQLQLEDRQDLRGRRPADRPTPTSQPTSATSSTSSPASRRHAATESCWSRRARCAAASSSGSRPRRPGARGPDRAQGQRADRPRDDRRALRGLQAGVPIDLAVRGMCCLRPGIPGLSETITVRSIVGEFLEHSRIYRFGPPADPGRAERSTSARPT